MLINPAVSASNIGGETVLLDENSGQLVLLNAVASVLWFGLESGADVTDIAAQVAVQSGTDPAAVAADLDALLGRWENLGLVLRAAGDKPTLTWPARTATHDSDTADIDEQRSPCANTEELANLGTYAVGEVVFGLHATLPEVRQAARAVLGHLRIDTGEKCRFSLTVEKQGGEWILFCDNEYVAHCHDQLELTPMLHANALLLVYRYSTPELALHAAAVATREHCIVLPAKSGSGKSTLTAALVSEGLRYCSDDLVLLTGPNLAVIPVSFCIGLKQGSWDIAAVRSPDVAELATYRRVDGHAIRYLPPRPESRVVGRDERLHTGFLVFPTYDQRSHNEYRTMSPGDALIQLTESGYDMPRPMDRNILQRLIAWIENIPCLELRYNRLEYAIDLIASLATGKTSPNHDHTR